MQRTTTVIIGAGQSGLAMSKALAARNVDHLILERGKVANSWRTERWDSLRLLTPNWMNGLPGAPYDGADSEGYMDCAELIGRFERAARTINAPVMAETSVLSVSPHWDGYLVQTDQGAISCKSVVLATGATNCANLPVFASYLPASIAQLSPLDYRNPAALAPGKVLVVGASSSGAQIAREIQMSGRDVILSVGEHVRVPRTYRDADVLMWMDLTGRWSESYATVEDLDRQRRLPSLQLAGGTQDATIDLNALQDIGIELVGRMAGVNGQTGYFSGALANHCALADLKMTRLLKGFDDWVVTAGLEDFIDPAERLPATRLPVAPRLSLDLVAERVTTIIWATGYRPDFGYLDLPVFDAKGRIRHDGGVVGGGLYVMVLPFLRRRKSTFIDGAEDDARDLAAHLVDSFATTAAA